jgi:lantibiotic modifying enzyme
MGETQDLRIALEWVERNPPASDDLCCGKLGAVELMLHGAQALDLPDLTDLACRRAAAIVEPAKRLAHPGLFVGLAGAGYTMLRLSEPSRLPSVLLWE